MANVSVFSVSSGGTDAMAATAIAGAAALQTVPCSKDSRMALRVYNGSAANVMVRIAAGAGPRAVLGDVNVKVAAGNTAYIALFDTARYKSAGNQIGVALLNEAGAALEPEALTSIRVEAIQL